MQRDVAQLWAYLLALIVLLCIAYYVIYHAVLNALRQHSIEQEKKAPKPPSRIPREMNIHD